MNEACRRAVQYSSSVVTSLLGRAPYNGYFSGEKFSWLRGEPRNFYPRKQYRIVPGCGLAYPTKNTRYTVVAKRHNHRYIALYTVQTMVVILSLHPPHFFGISYTFSCNLDICSLHKCWENKRANDISNTKQKGYSYFNHAVFISVAAEWLHVN